MKKYLRSSPSILAVILALWLIPGLFGGGTSADTDGIEVHPKAGCSSFCLINGGYAVFGTNFDYSDVFEGLLYVNKRGVRKAGFFAGTTGNSARWVSRYASITFNLAAYQYAWSGMNERGLMVSTMALDESVAPAPDERPPLDSGVWLQYVLDMCATVDDVIAIDSEVRILVADHYLISDRYGNCAAVEFLNGRMVVHTGENLPVAALTNTMYTESVSEWRQKNQGAFWNRYDHSLSRFVLAADRVADFRSRDVDLAVDYAFDTLYSVRIEQYFPQAASHWSIVYDARNMRIYFRTFYHPEIRYLDFYKMDLSCDTPVRMLDIQEELSGDVSDDFFDYSHEISYEHFLRFCDKWGVDLSSYDVDRWLRFWEGFPCTEDEPADEVLVSRDVLKSNVTPRLAINTATGDALVVWRQRDAEDPAYSRIRCAMLRRSLIGRYQLAESIPLTEDEGYNGNPHPIYLEGKELFLVVWDQADPAWPSAQSDIMGRIVSACGLPEGNAFKVLADGDRNEYPQIYFKAVDSAEPGKKNLLGKVNLVYSAVGTAGELNGVPQLRIAVLNRKYKARKPRLLVQGDVANVNGISIPERILPDGSGRYAGDSIVLPVSVEMIQENGTTSLQPKVMVIDNSNRLVEMQDIGKPGASRPCVAVFADGEDDATVICSTVRNKQVTNSVMSIPVDGRAPLLSRISEERVYKKALDSQILALAPNRADAQTTSSITGSKAIGYQFFAATNGRVYRRAISQQGRPFGPMKSVFEHDNVLQMMSGAEIVLSNGEAQANGAAEFIMVWQRWVSDGLQEIRAQLLQAPR